MGDEGGGPPPIDLLGDAVCARGGGAAGFDSVALAWWTWAQIREHVNWARECIRACETHILIDPLAELFIEVE